MDSSDQLKHCCFDLHFTNEKSGHNNVKISKFWFLENSFFSFVRRGGGDIELSLRFISAINL